MREIPRWSWQCRRHKRSGGRNRERSGGKREGRRFGSSRGEMQQQEQREKEERWRKGHCEPQPGWKWRHPGQLRRVAPGPIKLPLGLACSCKRTNNGAAFDALLRLHSTNCSSLSLSLSLTPPYNSLLSQLMREKDCDTGKRRPSFVKTTLTANLLVFWPLFTILLSLFSPY